LLAQMAHVDVARTRLAVGRVAPQSTEEHLAREDARRLTGEGRPKLAFDVGQLHRLAGELHRPPSGVDPQLAGLDGLSLSRALAGQAGPAQERPDPAPELPNGERLRDVVVRSALEPQAPD